MKKLLAATAASALFAGMAGAEDVKIGVLFGFTGPIESLTGSMAASAEAAMKEVSDSGLFLDGSTVTPVRADTGCIDAAMATASAEKLVTSDGVSGIVGADCSPASMAVLSNVAMPNGIVMISPSTTTPALTTFEDNGLFFRTAPSDAREGEIAADILSEKGITEAVTQGVLAGYPVVDVKVTLTFGSYHEVDSNENAFKMAASMGFKDGMRKAQPVLLEPMMAVEVETPEDYAGTVMGDLSSRRGMVQGMDDISGGGGKIIKAEVPLSEMFGYSTTLRSATQGRATYTMEFKHYSEAPKNVAEAIINAKK